VPTGRRHSQDRGCGYSPVGSTGATPRAYGPVPAGIRLRRLVAFHRRDPDGGAKAAAAGSLLLRWFLQGSPLGPLTVARHPAAVSLTLGVAPAQWYGRRSGKRFRWQQEIIRPLVCIGVLDRSHTSRHVRAVRAPPAREAAQAHHPGDRGGARRRGRDRRGHRHGGRARRQREFNRLCADGKLGRPRCRTDHQRVSPSVADR
jgi:hypothetical protein